MKIYRTGNTADFGLFEATSQRNRRVANVRLTAVTRGRAFGIGRQADRLLLKRLVTD